MKYRRLILGFFCAALLKAGFAAQTSPKKNLDPGFSVYPTEPATARVAFEELKVPSERSVTAVTAQLPPAGKDREEIQLEVVTMGNCSDQYLALEDEISDSVTFLRFANITPIEGLLRMPCERTLEYRWVPFIPYENFGTVSPFETKTFTLRVGPTQDPTDQFFEVQASVSVDKTDPKNVKVRYSDLKILHPSSIK